jgi:myo-inositol-1(or 4)-monophosphatase
MNWDKELSVARQASQEAGRILNSRLGQANRVMKKGVIDLVTEADLQSEKTIIDIIGRHFPDDRIIAEEGGEYGHLPERVWLIDPLDGTTNFTHNFPFFAVSIALEVEKELVVGTVFNPSTDEYFEAVKGKGSYLNAHPISVSHTEKLGDALLATGFPYDIHENPDTVLERFKRMVVRAQGIRRPGSAAIDLCYVADGRFDGFWEEGLKPWDTAAGILIVEEAGGSVSTYEGKPCSPFSKNIVASNSLIHKEMIPLLRSE